MARRKLRGRRGKGAKEPSGQALALLDGELSPEGEQERRTGKAKKARIVEMAKADPEFWREQVAFFHRTRTLFQMDREGNVRPRVQEAWKEQYGTELSNARFVYLAYDGGHDELRQECLREILDNGIMALLRDNPKLKLQSAFDWGTQCVNDWANKDKYLTLTGIDVGRVRDRGSDEWLDVPVVKQERPQQMITAALKFCTEIAKLEARAGQVVKAAGLAPGPQLAAQFNMNFGKASSLQATALQDGQTLNIDGDLVQQHFTREQAQALIAQEGGDPFHIPPESSSFSQYEHVRLKRALLAEHERKVAEGLLSVPPAPSDDGSVELGEVDRIALERQEEFSRGVVFDEKASAEADIAAKNVPDVRTSS